MSSAIVVTKRPVVPGTAKVGPAYATVPMPLTWMDMVAIKNDPSHNLYVIPFGPARGMVVVRTLENMDWKGVKGEEFWKVARKHGRLADGLKRAIAISKAFAGTKGVVFINGVPYPRKAIAQKEWKKKASEVEAIMSKLPY